MTESFSKLLAVAICAGFISACSTTPNGIRVVNDGTSAIPSKEGAKIRDLAAAEIGPAVVGKTFQFTRTNSSGIVTFNADGTLTIKDDQKGDSIGKWSASGPQYCESYGPSLPQECGVFKYTGDAYFAANTRLVELKV